MINGAWVELVGRVDRLEVLLERLVVEVRCLGELPPKEKLPVIKLPTMADIKEAVSQEFGVPMMEIMGQTRQKEVTFARHVAMYLSRRGTYNSHPTIGRHFGHRDHTTVMHACTRISKLRLNDRMLAIKLAKLESELGIVRP